MLFVLGLFSISYSYRLVFNFIQAFNMQVIEGLQQSSLSGYSLVIFGLYFVGEVVPLTLIFVFQYRNYKAVER